MHPRPIYEGGPIYISPKKEMANYSNLKSSIDTNIKTNGNEEITGAILNTVLNSMVTSLGAGYQFMGVATTSTNPGTPDAKVFYLAYTPGTYTNFNGIAVTGLCVLKYDTAWSKDDLPSGGGGGGYVLPEATAAALGGIKVGYTQTGKYYPVLLDESGNAYVYVPWTSGGGGGGSEVSFQDLASTSDNVSKIGKITIDGSDYYIYNDVAWGTEDSPGKTINIKINGTTKAVMTGIPPATISSRGGIIVGSGLSVDGDGVLSATGGGGGGGGTVTSVGMTVPSGFTVTGSPVTGSGTLAVSLDSQAKNKVLASPSGAAGIPSFRVLDASDIPNLDASKITSGTLNASRIPDLSSKYVTLDTAQTITGKKTFTGGVDANYIDLGDARLVWDSDTHSLHVTKRPGSSYAGDISIYADGDVAGGGPGSGSTVKYVNCANDAAYSAISPKDPATIYTIGTAPSFSKIYLGTIQIH